MKYQKAVSYITFGLTAPYYQYVDLPETFNSNDKICWAKRLTDNEFKKEYSYKDIEQKSFSIRYKNFIMSPRSNWIYLTV